MTADEAKGLHGMKTSHPPDNSDRRGEGQPWAGMLPVAVQVGTGRSRVELEVLAQGRDVVVRISGGATHVGAVAVCDGSAAADHVRPGGSILALPGHKEGPLAAEAAETLARALGCTCAAVVGIHQDDATPAEIHLIVANVRAGLGHLVVALAEPEGRHDI